MRRDSDDTLHVLKVARLRWWRLPHLSLPLPVQTAHEVAIHRRLQGLRGIPALTGRPTAWAFLHAWVPGRPLAPREPELPCGFLPALEQLVAAVHARGVAYADLEKEENILLGQDGHPHLVDFQISVVRPRWLVRVLQEEDRRHLLKHRKQLAPHTLTPAQATAVRQRSLPLRLHRLLTRPYFALRRRLQKRSRDSA